MKPNRDIRRETNAILTGKWFFRLILVGLSLQLIAMVVNGLLSSAFDALSITSLSDYLEAKLHAMRLGLAYALPTAKAFYWMLASFGLQTFISYVFAAIATFGIMRALLAAHANDDNRWFSGSFAGFAQPLHLTTLLLLQNLLVALWCLLFFIPGIIALYRYRLAWFVKIDHGEFSACACLRESARLMRGVKSQAFLLDLSYLVWAVLAGLLVAAASLLGMQGGLLFSALSFATGLVGFYLFVRTVLCIAVSRAVFYRALPCGSTVTAPSEAD